MFILKKNNCLLRITNYLFDTISGSKVIDQIIQISWGDRPLNFAIMPRGPDLSPNEVAMVHSKIKQFWDYEKAQIKHGGMKQIHNLVKHQEFQFPERR